MKIAALTTSATRLAPHADPASRWWRARSWIRRYQARADRLPRSWFDDEQLRVHAEVNRVWPRMLGTTPMGIARALTTRSEVRGVRYRWRLFRGRRDRLTDVLHAVKAGWPVAMLVGRFIPQALGADRRCRAGRRCSATSPRRARCGPRTWTRCGGRG